MLLVALAGVLVLVAVAAFLAWQQYGDTRDAAMNQSRSRAVLAGTIFDTYFTGQIATLKAMAAAPAVVAENEAAIGTYLKRVQPSDEQGGFTGGVGWIDRDGFSRASSNATTSVEPVSVADRSYFKAVMANDQPFISEGITTKRSNERVIVVAVPTHDESGAVSGLLAGAIRVTPTPTNSATIDLGFRGLAVFDRTGQSVLAGFAKPRNEALLQRISKVGASGGVFSDTRGLDGADGHVVAYARSAIPAWTIAIDEPRSTVLGSAQRSLALAIALLVGVAALVVALLIRTVRRARRLAERRAEQAQQQTDLTEALASAAVVNDVSVALADALASAFEDTLVVVALARENRVGLALAASAGGRFERSVHGASVLRVAEEALATGVPLVLDRHVQLRDVAPDVENAFHGSRRSLVAEPLTLPDGERLGAVVLLFAGEQRLEDEEQELVAAQAEQAALALERTRTREMEHDVALRLQRSLLPERLPAVPGLQIAARYSAGGAGLVIGGDWYDAVVRDDGLVHLTVGDVAGRGIGAATLMGQLRNAFRAYALDHDAPGELLTRLLRHVGGDSMATAVILTVDPRTCEVRYATAGHPPALVLDEPGGSVALLDGVVGPPLGTPDPPVAVEEVLQCRPGTTIVLYTDGLVEHRGERIDEGIAVVADTLAANAGLEPDALADAVLALVGGDGTFEDDVALLVVRLSGGVEPLADASSTSSVVGAGG